MRTTKRVTGAIRLAALCGAVVVGVGAAISGAHDEDWRKLADSEPRFEGPLVSIANGNVGIAGDFPAENIDLLAWIPLNQMPGNPQAGNDCWGYVSPTGREYAIFGGYNGYTYVEITDPGNPQIIGNVSGPGSTWHDVKVIGEYAYGVSEAGAGIQVMDLSDIDNGVVVHVQDKLQQGHSSTHNIAANPDSGYLYLCGANIGNGGLIAVNTNDPANPIIEQGWTEMYVHDAQVKSFTSGPHAGKEIAFCGAGFNGGWDASGLRIVDVTDKDNIFKTGEIQYPGAVYAHQCWVNDDGTLLYLDDELDEDNGVVPTTTTRVFDISDLTSPTLVTSFTNGSNAIDHNLYLHDGKLFAANYRSGLRVWDLEDPLDPTEVAFFDTYQANDNASFNGAWSVYPYFPSGTVIVSDVEKGLFILDVVIERLAFEFPQQLPDIVDPDSPTQVSVEVIEDGAVLDPASVTLHVSIDAGEFSDIPMTGPDGPGVFSADLPGASCYSSIAYYFSAESVGGDLFKTPNGAPGSTYNVAVLTGQNTIAEDAMEAPSGWTVGDAGDDATTGIWERANPVGTDAQPEDDHTVAGTQCWVTGAAGGAVGDNDIDNGKTTLQSPNYDLSGASVASMSYWRWYSNDAGNAPNTNIFVVDISDDGGNTWTNVETVGPGGIEVSGGWIQHSFNVNDFVELTDSIKLRFIAEDDPTDGQGSIVEAAIDDLQIDELICESGCVADFNNDGVLNILDFVALQVAFQAGDESADINGDGDLNILDFVAYQGLFQDGCD
jgi:choice-of-anchor B domain-containing protein